jgi:CheY-like chemotaxis protein
MGYVKTVRHTPSPPLGSSLCHPTERQSPTWQILMTTPLWYGGERFGVVSRLPMNDRSAPCLILEETMFEARPNSIKRLHQPNTLQPIRVIIADDHPIVRDGLEALLGTDCRVEVVGMANNFAEVLDVLGRMSADVLVLDLGGMGCAALTLVTRLRREHARVAIVVFSSSVDLAPELLQASVISYIVKEELSEQLLTAIHAARAGRPACRRSSRTTSRRPGRSGRSITWRRRN